MGLALREALERHLADAGVSWLQRGKPCPDWAFAASEGNLLDRNNVAKAFRRGCDPPCRVAAKWQQTPAGVAYHCRKLLVGLVDRAGLEPATS